MNDAQVRIWALEHVTALSDRPSDVGARVREAQPLADWLLGRLHAAKAFPRDGKGIKQPSANAGTAAAEVFSFGGGQPVKIILALGGKHEVAKLTGARPNAVVQWYRIGIPSKFWPKLVEARPDILNFELLSGTKRAAA